MEEEILSAVLYTDGSANNTLKIWGWGSHGYTFIKRDVDDPTKNKAIGVTITNIGYLEPGELKIRPHLVVNPLQYIDWYGSYTEPGTNNQAEVAAIIESVLKLIELNVKDILLYSDSTYALSLIEGAKKKTMDEIKRTVDVNLDFWLEARNMQDLLEENNVNLKLEKIKAHNNHLGNMIADDMAMLGRVESSRFITSTDFTLRGPKGYWKPKNERHTFLNSKQIFFTNDEAKFDGKTEYMLLGYKIENEIGKKMHVASYGYVVLNEPDSVIDLVKETYMKLLGNHSVVSTIRMDLLFKPDNYRYVERYGNKSLMSVTKNKRGISVIEKDVVANAINPPALAYTALSNVNILRLILRDFNALKASKDHVTAKEYIDITDMFYFTNEKGKNLILPELTNDVKELKYNYENDGKKADVVIQFGKDIITRNQLKKIEKLEPKVYLVVMNSKNVKIDYFTIVDIESTGDQSVWTNYYSKTVFLK